MRVVVIGAGVVGASTALALVERGLEVILLDGRSRIADATSHANGGGVTPLHAEPWNGPDLGRNLIGFIGRSDAPWQLPLRMLPALGGWGLKFLRNTRATRFAENARANIRLGLYSLERLREWRERYRFDYRQTAAGSLQLYFDRQAFERSLDVRRRLLEGLGVVEPLDVDAVVACEPALTPVAGRLAGGLFYPVHESGDAACFARCAAAEAERQGARLRLGEAVLRLVCENGRFASVQTDRGMIPADACVIAAGAETPSILRPLGLRVPIESVRGYSATFEIDDPAALPTRPLLDAAHRFVTLRLGEHGLRVAGLADFAGHRRAIPPARMDVLLASACKLLPALSGRLTPAAGRLWAGLRPVTPDGRPLVGPTRIDGLYLNAGHGPMGWTMACGSAALLADRITGRSTLPLARDVLPSRAGL